jgi:hypothetical protein
MKDHYRHTVTSEQMAEQCYRDALALMKDHGWCTVEIKAGGRSLPQNALYWEWMTYIADHINKRNSSDFNKDDLHDRMRHDFLGYNAPRQIGSTTVKERLKTTTELTTGEMYHYMSQIDAWAASVGILLPRPEDCQYEKLKRKENGQD